MSGPAITVLGVGNAVMGDDAAGLEILRLLKARYAGFGSYSDTDSAPAPSAVDVDSLVPLASASATPGVPSHVTVATATATDIAAGPDGRIGDVAFVEGGTSGLELVGVVGEARKLLVLDGLTGPGEPGDVVVLEGDQVPRLLSSKLSPHQVGLLDLLATARLLGHEPEHVGVVGVVCASAELEVRLTPEVAAGLPAAVDAAAEVLERWASG
nr:hydrogenase maturation protease [Corynebacterium hansenii]